MRMSALGRLESMAAGTGLPGRHGCPGLRLAGVGIRSSFASFGTLVKRPVWYALVTAPLRERHGEPGAALHFGHGWRSTRSASDSGSPEGS